MFEKILRASLAIVFIISAVVKAIDPVGFSFKLEEYFSPQVFNLNFLESHSLPIAILVVGLELLLGLMLLLNIRIRFSLISLISLCAFFAFLTFYSAYWNVVTDCGCFGDAIKFTPWQSFVKDIVLLLGLLVLYKIHKNSTPSKRSYILLFLASLGCSWVMVQGVQHEPIIDFRDYKIGTDLAQEKKKLDEQPAKYQTIYFIKNKVSGEEMEINQEDYIKQNYWEDQNWEIEEGKTKSVMNTEGYSSSIAQFKIETIAGEDLTPEVLKAPKAYLLFSYLPEKITTELSKYEKEIRKNNNLLVLGISTNIQTFKNIPNAVMDKTAIKTIARSNPFVLVLEHGVIKEKMSAEDFFSKKP